MTHYPNHSFTITHRHNRARIGQLRTPHGVIETPAFVFCATKGAIRVATTEMMQSLGTQVILGNTYHLMLQPTAEGVAALGGLHHMMQWPGPMFTDSGGYQVFSLNHGSISEDARGERLKTHAGNGVKITEEGAHFKSHIDGSAHFLTPEKSMQVQRALGADLVFVLDEHTALSHDYAYTATSMDLTHRWARRCLAEFDRTNDGKQGVYGIVQGGVYADLRRRGAQFVAENDFFGQGLGGCWGRSKDELWATYNACLDDLHKDRPIHLLGIGDVEDIVVGAGLGIDTFDCVTPTRHARHGVASVWHAPKFRLNLHNAKYRNDTAPIEQGCGCPVCQKYSRGYIHHLIKAKEPLAFVLLAQHNVWFMNQLMMRIRDAIRAGTYADFQRQTLAGGQI